MEERLAKIVGGVAIVRSARQNAASIVGLRLATEAVVSQIPGEKDAPMLQGGM